MKKLVFDYQQEGTNTPESTWLTFNVLEINPPCNPRCQQQNCTFLFLFFFCALLSAHFLLFRQHNLQSALHLLRSLTFVLSFFFCLTRRLRLFLLLFYLLCLAAMGVHFPVRRLPGRLTTPPCLSNQQTESKKAAPGASRRV